MKTSKWLHYPPGLVLYWYCNLCKQKKCIYDWWSGQAEWPILNLECKRTWATMTQIGRRESQKRTFIEQQARIHLTSGCPQLQECLFSKIPVLQYNIPHPYSVQPAGNNGKSRLSSSCAIHCFSFNSHILIHKPVHSQSSGTLVVCLITLFCKIKKIYWGIEVTSIYKFVLKVTPI